ncbi:MAG TPA: anion permease [Chloroflexota bacterium]|nr:anion permease [Chloroflexota bacterium]
MHNLALTILVIAVALFFDFTNGFHDTANAIATSVSTHALSPRAAVILSAAMNFVGAFVTTKVAATIGGGVIPAAQTTLIMVLAAVMGAITWNLITWYQGLPSSSTHALVGGLIGVGIVAIGFGGVKWASVIGKIVVPLVISPILGFIVSYIGMLLIYWLFRGTRPRAVNGGFRFAQIFSAAFVSFSHGTNDSQKTMGIITLALVTQGYLSRFAVPVWVIAAAACAMAFGTYAGGWRIIRTMGTRLYKISPAEGFDAQLVAAIIIQGAAQFGLPVSTTHVVTGAVLGAGTTDNPSAVRWGVGINIVTAWILTIPAAAVVAGVLYFLVHFIAR